MRTPPHQHQPGSAADLILDRVEPWAGSREAAEAWYRAYHIAALGGLTAEHLVADGRAAEVLRYLEHIREGGFS